MEKLKYKRVEVSISGDYYQIVFEDDPEDLDTPYFQVQCDFEFPDTKCYIESNKEHLIGHYIVNSVAIKNRTLEIKYGPNDKFVVFIEYDATEAEQAELINASKEMFENITINP